jgi:hypothetical protein
MTSYNFLCPLNFNITHIEVSSGLHTVKSSGKLTLYFINLSAAFDAPIHFFLLETLS